MFSRFKKGEIVLVRGIGQNDKKCYNNVLAKVIERDPYYKDYLIQFEDGSEDWLIPRYLLKLNKKGVKI